MDPQTRFEILQPIAAGDFATVYRARDRELGREVAIKQIHAQFLQDPRHLDRYWQEAQILASLEHPHIVRIYDIVRDRGWLVLELMQGSLKQMLAGRPIDLGDLRMTLTYSAHALQFMHANGILHGDVKPSNLLVDKSQRVKLGDFGIARRIFGEHGSVVKGTTRYMAPEVVSDQFGPVGPHSDLYSLGFSAYELLCGADFDSLFPGLNMYGRDQQIAWMMWHSALDRRLPDIQRVLEGVPPDLAYVIQRLTEKDATKRYRTAEEVLADLKSGAIGPTGPSPEELAAAEAEKQRQAKRKRWLAVAACVFSVGATCAMFLIPGPEVPSQVAAPADARPTAGRVGEIDLERQIVFIQPDDGTKPHGLEFHADRDRIFVNDRKGSLTDLRHDERVEIRYLSSGGEGLFELSVQRAAESDVRSVAAAIDPEAATLALAPATEGAEPVSLYVPDSAAITLNGQSRVGGRALRLADLQPNDRVSARYIPSDEGRMVATAIAVLRRVSWEGLVMNRLPAKNQLEVRLTAVGSEPGSPSVGATKVFALAADCRLSINGQGMKGAEPWSLADLQTGDVVKLEADSLTYALAATREERAQGKVAQIDPATRVVSLQPAEGSTARKFRLAAQGTIQLEGSAETIDLAFVRPGDQVTMELATAADSSGDRLIEKLLVTPTTDPRAWAVLISQAQHDDQALPKLDQASVDIRTLRTTLTQRYRVPEAQILSLEDASRLRLTQELGDFLGKVAADSQLICVYAGLAFLDPAASPVLAPKEYDSNRPAETGTPLRWLVDQLGASAAREKLLVIDASPVIAAGTGPAIVSTYEIVEALRPKPTRPISASVLVLGSCEKGQKSRTLKPGEPSLFASTVAAAWSGAADANRDGRVSGVELVEYVVREVAQSAGAESPQRPVAWLPENRPPRLAAAAREGVFKLLSQIRAPRPSETIGEEFQAANQQAAEQPDVALAFGLVMLKHNRTPVSRPLFEKIRAEHPKCAVAHQALAWQNFLQGKPVEGLADLRQMIETLPDPLERPENEPFFLQAVELAGVLREFSLRAAEPPVDTSATKLLDQAVIARGEEAKVAYQKGIAAVRDGIKRVDELIADAPDPTKQRSLQLDRKRVTYYTTFNFAIISEYVRQAADE